MFEGVLVANRGEIAVRVIRTLKRLGIRSIAVHTSPDRDARHVLEADAAVAIGRSGGPDGYLDPGEVLRAVASSGADAVHPGYGFLSERADFARACAGAGVVFVGPPPASVEQMGDKIRAREAAEAAGVPVVPGRGAPGLSDAELAAAAIEIGLPVLLKPSAGGGGKGMHLVEDERHLAGEIAQARREARSAFGDDTLLVERWISPSRHIEIQVLADSHGHVVHLGERECSLQRRHQKVLEEAPSPALDDTTRDAMCTSAVALARACGYVGAGTVELIVAAERPEEFFFLEMNTRLQVEHPVTEMVTGLDLVELQLRVAAGEELAFGDGDVAIRGHAVEARVYAEDASRGFLPTGGTVLALDEASGEHIRVDSGLVRGLVVGSTYDPMLAKVVAWAPERTEALRRLRGALSDTTVLGVVTNIGYLSSLLGHRDVVAGRLDTGLVDRTVEVLARRDDPDHVLAAAALALSLEARSPGETPGPWAAGDGWRLGHRAWTLRRLAGTDGGIVEVRQQGRADDAVVVVGDGPAVRATATAGAAEGTKGVTGGGGLLLVTYGGETCSYRVAVDAGVVWLAAAGRTWAFEELALGATAGPGAAVAAGGPITSPMPGVVSAVHVGAGERVRAGQELVGVEAMKMEHALVAPVAGTVTEVLVGLGDKVALGQPLVVVEPGDDETAEEPGEPPSADGSPVTVRGRMGA